MDIVCSRCGTEYEFDEAKVSDAGVTVKCTNCEYVFKVRTRQVVETEPVSNEPAEAEDNAPASRPWMIRRTSGEVLTFEVLPTLQQWIVEGKVSREDQISRSGDTWKRLGDIAELGAFFQAVDAAKTASPVDGAKGSQAQDTIGPTTMGERRAAATVGPAAMGEPRKTTRDEPAFTAAASGAQFKTVGPRAAWEDSGRRVGEVEEDDVVPVRRSGRLVGLVILVLLVLAGGAFAALKPDAVKQFISGLFAGGEQESEAYRQGRELFLQDDEDSLRRADQQFARARQNNARALAARVEVATVWAQHLRDEAEILDRHAQQLDSHATSSREPDEKGTERGKKPPATELAEQARSLRLRASKLRDEAAGKLSAAREHADSAFAAAAEQAEVNRAMADLRRMEGKRGDEVVGLLAKALKAKPNDPETYYVQGMYWEGLDDRFKAIDLLKESIVKTRAYTKQVLLRAAFALAMIHLRAGRRDEAQRQVEVILRDNPQHGWAKRLAEQIEAESQGGMPAMPTKVAQPTTDRQPPAKKSKTPPPAKAPQTPPKPRTPARAEGSYESLVRSGNRLAEHGRTMQALAAYEAALKKKPRGVEAITGLAFCQLDLQRYSMAISRFRQAMNISPTYGEAMIGMAEAYKAMGNKKRALDYYEAYLRTYPNGPKKLLATRNVKDIERELGKAAPAPQPPPQQAPAPVSPEAAPPAVPSGGGAEPAPESPTEAQTPG